MKNFLTKKDFPLNPGEPIRARVFSKYRNKGYDFLDDLAKKRGYSSIEPSIDEKANLIFSAIGMQNGFLHSGWIATMGDSCHNIQNMINLLNEKVKIISETKRFIVGFCQTGHFSVGYSIYIKP